MELFKKANKLEMAYLKAGLYGEAGTGKTWTSSLIAIGLHKYIKAEKPIYFFDTEQGSDFVLHLFKEAKIDLFVTKTRAFKDLLDAIDIAEEKAAIFIFDSVTHVWNEMLSAYQKKLKISRITLRHWIPLKSMWREFTERFVNSNLHIIMAGRSAYIWDDVEDEEGVKELKKVGTRLRAETEMSYEPSLLIELDRERKSSRAGGAWIHRAWIMKDRFGAINGEHFDNPTFDSFLPHISRLGLGGKHKAIEAGRDSQELFENDNLGQRKYKKQQILLEEIKGEIVLLYPGQDADSKKKKAELLKEIFGTLSWTNVESMGIDDLDGGLKAIKKRVEKPKKEDKK